MGTLVIFSKKADLVLGQIIEKYKLNKYEALVKIDSISKIFTVGKASKKEVVDYLNARVANGDNISAISVPEAYRLTAVWKNKNLTDPKLPDVIGVDVKFFSELGNGYKILQLLTPKALDRESTRCAHCIGKGGYDHLLKNETNKFLSLRDSEDNDIATFHIINTNQISQLKGHNNRPVQQDFWPMIKDFIIQNQLVMINDFELIGLKKPKPK